jgi:nucleoid-associated protein YgaU
MSHEALYVVSGNHPRGAHPFDRLQLFAAVLLCRPFEPLNEATLALVDWARAEAARWARAGRGPIHGEEVLALRFVYRGLREEAASVRPIPLGQGPPWEKAMLALSWLRHRQRAALALGCLNTLSGSDMAVVIGVVEGQAARVLEAATAALAKAMGEPVDVSDLLRRAADELLEPAEATAPPARAPRPVVRGLIGRTVPSTPAVVEAASDAPSAVSVLLAEAEEEPADITPPAVVAPSPPNPSIREKTPRGPFVIAALAIALILVAVLLPASARHPATPARPAARTPAVLTQRSAAGQTRSAAVPLHVVTVVRGDSLWLIAGRDAGDPLRWRQIWLLNQGRRMKTGERFTNPNLIRPGWVLRLPRS